MHSNRLIRIFTVCILYSHASYCTETQADFDYSLGTRQKVFFFFFFVVVVVFVHVPTHFISFLFVL